MYYLHLFQCVDLDKAKENFTKATIQKNFVKNRLNFKRNKNGVYVRIFLFRRSLSLFLYQVQQQHVYSKRRWTPNLVYRLKRNGIVIDSTYYFKEKVSPATPNVTYLERRALNKMAFVDGNDITGYTIEFFFAEIEDIPNTSPSKYLYKDIIKIDEIPISKINFHLSESDFRIYDPRLRRYVYFDIPLNKL